MTDPELRKEMAGIMRKLREPKTDLVKRLRDGLKQCQELGIQYSPAQDLISDMADEIERLREALADLIEQADRGRRHEMGLFRACERARKALEGK